jgi:D-alanyl-lipoteichoic acid acyltransferase DltB (MBOAT superfamily)
MDNASLKFVGFGLLVAWVLNLGGSRLWRSTVLLTSSLLFLYMLADRTLDLVPLGGFLLFGYGCVRVSERGWRAPMSLGLPLIVLVYAWLKKYTFIPGSVDLQFPYLTLGLSYIVLRVLHLVIETAEDEELAHIGVGSYLLYMLNFTTFVSGPIQRYDEFSRDQLAREPIALDSGIVALQLERIIRGFFKVNVLAMLLHAVQLDALVAVSSGLPTSLRLIAGLELALVYPLFLYSNFSGYIDIVIALARLMRLRLPENFDRPFATASVLEFWSHWHMTLSDWLKTYVYNPLLLALMRHTSSVRIQPFLGVFCFFVTFFLVGIWHGRTSEFVMFGLLNGGGISLNKLWQITLTHALGRKPYQSLSRHVLYVGAGRGLTYTWLSFSLIWFWGNWAQITRVFASLSALQWLAVWLGAWLVATVALQAWEVLRGALLSIKSSQGPVLINRYGRMVLASTLGLAAFVFTVLLDQPAPSVVYKAF